MGHSRWRRRQRLIWETTPSSVLDACRSAEAALRPPEQTSARACSDEGDASMQKSDTSRNASPARSARECCTDAPCDSGLRNQYFEGKRLTADSFRVEQ